MTTQTMDNGIAETTEEITPRWRTLAELAAVSPYPMLDIDAMTRVVVAHHFRHGDWLYHAFDYVNDRYFSGQLAQPIIIPVEVHAWGRAIAMCGHTGRITINRARALPNLYAAHIVLHECIHHRLLQVYADAAHEDDAWLAECQRIAPLLETPIDPELLAMNKPVRVGKSVRRQQPDGTLPYKNAVARFPLGTYEEMGSKLEVYQPGGWKLP